MKFKIEKASDCKYEKTIEINSLEELLAFKNGCGDSIIIGHTDGDGFIHITIYDDYLE